MFSRLLFLMIAAGGLVGWRLASAPAAGDGPAVSTQTAQTRPDSTPPAAAQPAPALSPSPPSSDGYGGRQIIIERKADGHFYADATINGQLVRFLVDTGATTVALTARDARHVGLFFSPNEFTAIGRGASGEVRGKLVTIDRIALGHVEARQVRGAIIDDGLDISLLGQSFLSRIGSVRIADDRMTLR
ncbi:retropepsin-like aspartic protease family protein [Sphingomonas sp. KC8]|uniref:retropepsin-like aspartic protease family protein n=1 Tax=Sphingomonas sp. KC8 TaxID=1030157 RepID=UPI00024893D5|nr:TIGR02281 family clan AA aspartic protease [Sphingomonas sp. KC8]ARS26781.1 aspartyl protease [Sphingomonas sp. KC8]